MNARTNESLKRTDDLSLSTKVLECEECSGENSSTKTTKITTKESSLTQQLTEKNYETASTTKILLYSTSFQSDQLTTKDAAQTEDITCEICDINESTEKTSTTRRQHEESTVTQHKKHDEVTTSSINWKHTLATNLQNTKILPTVKEIAIKKYSENPDNNSEDHTHILVKGKIGGNKTSYVMTHKEEHVTTSTTDIGTSSVALEDAEHCEICDINESSTTKARHEVTTSPIVLKNTEAINLAKTLSTINESTIKKYSENPDNYSEDHTHILVQGKIGGNKTSYVITNKEEHVTSTTDIGTPSKEFKEDTEYCEICDLEDISTAEWVLKKVSDLPLNQSEESEKLAQGKVGGKEGSSVKTYEDNSVEVSLTIEHETEKQSTYSTVVEETKPTTTTEPLQIHTTTTPSTTITETEETYLYRTIQKTDTVEETLVNESTLQISSKESETSGSTEKDYITPHSTTRKEMQTEPSSIKEDIFSTTNIQTFEKSSTIPSTTITETEETHLHSITQKKDIVEETSTLHISLKESETSGSTVKEYITPHSTIEEEIQTKHSNIKEDLFSTTNIRKFEESSTIPSTTITETEKTQLYSTTQKTDTVEETSRIQISSKESETSSSIEEYKTPHSTTEEEVQTKHSTIKEDIFSTTNIRKFEESSTIPSTTITETEKTQLHSTTQKTDTVEETSRIQISSKESETSSSTVEYKTPHSTTEEEVQTKHSTIKEDIFSTTNIRKFEESSTIPSTIITETEKTQLHSTTQKTDTVEETSRIQISSKESETSRSTEEYKTPHSTIEEEIQTKHSTIKENIFSTTNIRKIEGISTIPSTTITETEKTQLHSTTQKTNTVEETLTVQISSKESETSNSAEKEYITRHSTTEQEIYTKYSTIKEDIFSTTNIRKFKETSTIPSTTITETEETKAHSTTQKTDTVEETSTVQIPSKESETSGSTEKEYITPHSTIEPKHSTIEDIFSTTEIRKFEEISTTITETTQKTDTVEETSTFQISLKESEASSSTKKIYITPYSITEEEMQTRHIKEDVFSTTNTREFKEMYSTKLEFTRSENETNITQKENEVASSKTTEEEMPEKVTLKVSRTSISTGQPNLTTPSQETESKYPTNKEDTTNIFFTTAEETINFSKESTTLSTAETKLRTTTEETYILSTVTPIGLPSLKESTVSRTAGYEKHEESSTEEVKTEEIETTYTEIEETEEVEKEMVPTEVLKTFPTELENTQETSEEIELSTNEYIKNIKPDHNQQTLSLELSQNPLAIFTEAESFSLLTSEETSEESIPYEVTAFGDSLALLTVREEVNYTENTNERTSKSHIIIQKPSPATEPTKTLVVIINNTGKKIEKLKEETIEKLVNKTMQEVSLEYIDLFNISKESKTINKTEESQFEMPEILKGDGKQCAENDFNMTNHCSCDVNAYLKSLEGKLGNDMDMVDVNCPKMISFHDGFIITNKTEPLKRKKRSLLYLSNIGKPSNVIENDYIEDVFDKEYVISQTGSSILVYPNRKAKIYCDSIADKLLDTNGVSFKWEFIKDNQDTDEVLPFVENPLIIQTADMKTTGNYTCTKTSKDGKQENFTHELELITFPIYKIKIGIFYWINDSCSLSNGDVLFAYLPKIMGPLLCGGTGKLCRVDMNRPRCVTKDVNTFFNVTITATMNDIYDILTSVKDEKCSLNCKFRAYANLVYLVHKNAQVIQKIPVFSKLNENLDFLPNMTMVYGSKPPKIITTCAGGYGIEKFKQKVCVICPKHTFSTADETFCKMCPAGQYQPQPGSQGCIPCKSPVDDTMCLRMLYSDTKMFKIYVGASFGFVFLILIVLIYWNTTASKNPPKYRYSPGPTYRPRSQRRKLMTDEENPLLEPLLKRDEIKRNSPPAIPPPDF